MKEKELSIYNHDAIYSQRLKALEKSSILPENKKAILEVAQACLNRGSDKATATKHIYRLSCLAKKLNKPFNKATREDIAGLVGWINQSQYTAYGQRDLKLALRHAFNVFEAKKQGLSLDELAKEHKEPRLVSWIDVSVKEKSKKLPEDLPTLEEVLAIVSGARSIRDKALILSCYESAARIEEIGSMRVKDLQFDNYGAKLSLQKSKTKSRQVRVVSSTALLSSWLNTHPDRENPESPLWLSYQGNVMCHKSLEKILKTAARHASYKKKLHWHLLRHARLTELAKNLTDAQQRTFAGWSGSSRMPEVYNHLSQKDIGDKILEISGVVQKEQEADKLQPKRCLACNTLNAPSTIYCEKCGKALDLKTVLEQESKNEAIQTLKYKELESRMQLLETMLKGKKG